MLESSELLILPWKFIPATAQDPSPGWTRRVLDPVTGARLGFVTSSTRRWAGLSWCQRHQLDVFEDPDASSLMSVRRPWGVLRMWQVHDADERYIGAVYQGYLFDGVGYFFAYAEPSAGPTTHFFTRGRVHLGSWTNLPDGAGRLVFTPCLESSPFARMILLGRALHEQPCP